MKLDISLGGWIIQDGNYKDFEAGKEYRFALEFWPKEAARAEPGGKPRFAQAGECLYEVYGQILFNDPIFWVVDFGLPAFQDTSGERLPSWITQGGWVRGKFHLGVDPFMYMDTHSKRRGVPDLFRRWRIEKILLDTTPMILDRTEKSGRQIYRFDETRASSMEVAKTDAWHHRDGHSNYVLQCELLPG